MIEDQVRKAAAKMLLFLPHAIRHEYLAIITAYIPDPAEWDETGRKRRSDTQ